MIDCEIDGAQGRAKIKVTNQTLEPGWSLATVPYCLRKLNRCDPLGLSQSPCSYTRCSASARLFLSNFDRYGLV